MLSLPVLCGFHFFNSCPVCNFHVCVGLLLISSLFFLISFFCLVDLDPLLVDFPHRFIGAFAFARFTFSRWLLAGHFGENAGDVTTGSCWLARGDDSGTRTVAVENPESKPVEQKCSKSR